MYEFKMTNLIKSNLVYPSFLIDDHQIWSTFPGHNMTQRCSPKQLQLLRELQHWPMKRDIHLDIKMTNANTLLWWFPGK